MQVEKVTRPLTKEERFDYAERRQDARKYGGQMTGFAASLGAYNTPKTVTEYIVTDGETRLTVKADSESAAMAIASDTIQKQAVSNWWLALPDAKRREYRQQIFNIDTDLNAAEYFYSLTNKGK